MMVPATATIEEIHPFTGGLPSDFPCPQDQRVLGACLFQSAIFEAAQLIFLWNNWLNTIIIHKFKDCTIK